MDLSEIELLVLTTAVDAEDNGIDVHQAAQQVALQRIEQDRFYLMLQRMNDAGLIDARLNPGNDRLMSAHLVKVLPAGLDAARRSRVGVSAEMLTLTDRLQLEELLGLLQQIIEEAPPTEADDRADFEAQVTTLSAQYKSPRGLRRVVMESARSLRSTLEGAAGNALWAGAIVLIDRLLK